MYFCIHGFMWYFKFREFSSILSQTCDCLALISLNDVISYEHSFYETTKIQKLNFDVLKIIT